MAKRRATTDRHFAAEGPSQRQLKVGEALRRRLAEILARGDAHDPELARFSITVSEVRTSPDLKQATAFVLPLGGREAAEALEALRRNAGQLRRLVSRDLHLKYAPELKFVLDDSFDRMDRARALLDADRVRRDTRPETDAEPEAE